ncbi:MAG TPA: sigma-70 family RNA polymerase sigma factor [Pirellulales bacterium]|jgi:RNA polymerase sigma-70 factor (ECF subfamily)|nr:sigma-70 family RNA polymerase sigma factor [Pirellulales bacterium]
MPDRLEQWLEQHAAALVLFARGWVPGHADAEDVVQEAFVRFWRSRSRVSDPAAYLYACVKRCALEWLRAGSRRSRREETIARAEAEPLFEDAIEQQERRAAIEAALVNLPEKQREVLVLRIWGDLSFPQIAEALGVPTETAASRYRYALAKLHEEFAKEPIL